MFSKWIQGLDKTRKAAFSMIATAMGSNEIDEYLWDDLEAILIQADLGVETAQEIISNLKNVALEESLYRSSDLVKYFKKELSNRLSVAGDPLESAKTQKPYVILMVGVNGSGKTTTTAKLAKKYHDAGKKVMLAAGDTYRAAAIDQLQVWGDRLNIPVICGIEGGDSAAVAFDAVQAAVSRGIDILIIDTAGRLHSRSNLMEELKKVHRVIGKALEGAPHAVWIVLDATTGQNALAQAKAFKETVKVNGVILAKLDTSAKGGMAFAVTNELDLPIIYAGLGEKPDDVELFNRERFVDSIIGD